MGGPFIAYFKIRFFLTFFMCSVVPGLRSGSVPSLPNVAEMLFNLYNSFKSMDQLTMDRQTKTFWTGMNISVKLLFKNLYIFLFSESFVSVS
jgi:hypothetical protein